MAESTSPERESQGDVHKKVDDESPTDASPTTTATSTLFLFNQFATSARNRMRQLEEQFQSSPRRGRSPTVADKDEDNNKRPPTRSRTPLVSNVATIESSSNSLDPPPAAVVSPKRNNSLVDDGDAPLPPSSTLHPAWSRVEDEDQDKQEEGILGIGEGSLVQTSSSDSAVEARAVSPESSCSSNPPPGTNDASIQRRSTALQLLERETSMDDDSESLLSSASSPFVLPPASSTNASVVSSASGESSSHQSGMLAGQSPLVPHAPGETTSSSTSQSSDTSNNKVNPALARWGIPQLAVASAAARDVSPPMRTFAAKKEEQGQEESKQEIEDDALFVERFPSDEDAYFQDEEELPSPATRGQAATTVPIPVTHVVDVSCFGRKDRSASSCFLDPRCLTRRKENEYPENDYLAVPPGGSLDDTHPTARQTRDGSSSSASSWVAQQWHKMRQVSQYLRIQDDPLILRMPNTGFGVCLGLAAHAALWRTAQEASFVTDVLGQGGVELANTLLWFAAFVLGVMITLAYAYKAFFHWSVVKAEFLYRTDYFFPPLLAMMLLGMSIPTQVEYSRGSLEVIFSIGILLQCLLCQVVYNRILLRERAVISYSSLLSTPGWLLLSILGSQAEIERVWGIALPAMCLGVGCLMYLYLLIGMHRRNRRSSKLPQDPSAIHLVSASPSWAVLAIQAILFDPNNPTSMPIIAHVVLGCAVLWVALLLSTPKRLWSAIVKDQPVCMGQDWAHIVFSSASFGIAWLAYSQAQGDRLVNQIVAACILAGVTLIMVLVAARMLLYIAYAMTERYQWKDPLIHGEGGSVHKDSVDSMDEDDKEDAEAKSVSRTMLDDEEDSDEVEKEGECSKQTENVTPQEEDEGGIPSDLSSSQVGEIDGTDQEENDDYSLDETDLESQDVIVRITKVID